MNLNLITPLNQCKTCNHQFTDLSAYSFNIALSQWKPTTLERKKEKKLKRWGERLCRKGERGEERVIKTIIAIIKQHRRQQHIVVVVNQVWGAVVVPSAAGWFCASAWIHPHPGPGLPGPPAAAGTGPSAGGPAEGPPPWCCGWCFSGSPRPAARGGDTHTHTTEGGGGGLA